MYFAVCKVTKHVERLTYVIYKYVIIEFQPEYKKAAGSR